ncbi:hypothetical protein LGK95_20610 [Clostridium algoriphilum]|uniref:hypothetical protein n=1 Tax=Clostridium algoriphilum TaxID=198347 RepID=UPI001CF3F83F|nr:hypothetical protein [Clostridium algoriphilum]MCB2295868.1 hypothetical protein [Clostridium algoriphilum]
MFKLDNSKKLYPLWAMLIGLISFLISGIIIGLISLITSEGLILILGVPIGSLLMLFVLHKLDKSNLLAVVIRSELGGFIGFFMGFMIGELLGGVVAFFFPSLSDMTQIKLQIMPNIVVLIVANAIFGASLADLFYGRKSICFFALVCGIVSIPFGLLLSIPIDIAWISFDQNLLFIVTSFGTTTGLSIGLYSLLKLGNKS